MSLQTGGSVELRGHKTNVSTVNTLKFWAKNDRFSQGRDKNFRASWDYHKERLRASTCALHRTDDAHDL